MPVNPGDSPVMGVLYGTDAMRLAMGERAFLARMVDVEAALARAQARLGIVPAEAAMAITQAAQVDRLDLHALAEATRNTGYPVVGLVKQLTALAGADAGRWTHWGATTQDVMDTAVVLQMRQGLALIRCEVLAVIGGLAVSQALTLFVTPVLDLGFDGLARRFSRGRGQAGMAAAPAE